MTVNTDGHNHVERVPLQDKTAENTTTFVTSITSNDASYNGAECQRAQPKTKNRSDLLYTVDENPPLAVALFLALQAYLTMFSAIVTTQLLLASRIITLLQSTFGTRLPIVQGPSTSFLLPAFVILSMDKFKCPSEQELRLMTSAQRYEKWTTSMRELQGAIMVASAFQVLIGISGVIGFLMRYIGPLTIGPVIASIGLSLFEPAGQNAGKYWPIAVLTAALVTLFSQILSEVRVPLPMWRRATGWHIHRLPMFKLLPVFLSVVIAWLLCTVLTLANVLPLPPPDSDWATSSGLHTMRVDTRIDILYTSAWLRVPYPFQFGWPTLSVSAVLGMAAGVLAGMIESIGDYYACARLAGAAPPPAHAVNRGIMIEGIGCVVAGAFGTGTGSTSYSENIGAIGITKVGSRRVIQLAGMLMIGIAVFNKIGALFATIPDPVIGGIFCIMCGMVAAVGISNLQFVDLNSSRNLFVFGVPLLMGLAVPNWLRANPTALSSVTPVEELNRLFSVLLTTGMFVTGFLAFVLDNILPGTDVERGLLTWKGAICAASDADEITDNYGEVAHNRSSSKNSSRVPDKTYGLPFGLNRWAKAVPFSRHIPILPNYAE